MPRTPFADKFTRMLVVGDTLLQRILAPVEVAFSNFMIEAWWRSLKQNWLHLHELDDFEVLRGLISFYVEQHNTVIPHAAFRGQTPDEMYFGGGESVPDELAEARRRAREARMEANRRVTCEACRASAGPGTASEPLPQEEEIAA